MQTFEYYGGTGISKTPNINDKKSILQRHNFIVVDIDVKLTREIIRIKGVR